VKKVGIIGAGLSGLYAACHLSKAGYAVEVFEKNGMAGGRSQSFSADGFTFDMGPTWYWMPDVIDRLFSDLGEDRSAYFGLTQLDPAYRVYWKDSTCTDIPASHEALIALFDTLETQGGPKLEKFLKDAQVKYDTAMHSFIENPGLRFSELLQPGILRDALKLDVFKSVEKDVARRFKSDKARNLLNFPVLFLGERPEKIPAMYTLMNYADLVLGTWYPEGGMNALAQALEKIALKHGAQFHYRATVEGVEVDQDAVSGLKVNGETKNFDAVIASADYHFVEQTLLPAKYRRYSASYWAKRKMAPSALIFYLGFDRKLDFLDHHNLFFDEVLRDHGREIYEHPRWPSKPLFYACAASKSDPQVAPEGCENLMILIPIAPDLEDSAQERENYLQLVLDRLEKHGQQSIRPNMIYQNSFAVNDFKSAYNSFKGNAYGLANTLRQTANLKPKLKSKLKKLYFCGQLTVPGPGIPPSLISGKIAAKELAKEV
jgi:phytoene desaturase